MQSLAFRDCVLEYQSIEASRRLIREYSGLALMDLSWVLDLHWGGKISEKWLVSKGDSGICPLMDYRGYCTE